MGRTAEWRELPLHQRACHRNSSTQKQMHQNPDAKYKSQTTAATLTVYGEMQILLLLLLLKIIHKVQKDRIRQKKRQNNQHVHKWHAMNDMSAAVKASGKWAKPSLTITHSCTAICSGFNVVFSGTNQQMPGKKTWIRTDLLPCSILFFNMPWNI